MPTRQCLDHEKALNLRCDLIQGFNRRPFFREARSYDPNEFAFKQIP
jgi:hypothetical protein